MAPAGGRWPVTDYQGRPGLQSIASRTREAKPGFAWVFVWKLSRFGRDLEEGLVYRALVRKRGIELISPRSPSRRAARNAHHPHTHGRRPVLCGRNSSRCPSFAEGVGSPGVLGGRATAGRQGSRNTGACFTALERGSSSSRAPGELGGPHVGLTHRRRRLFGQGDVSLVRWFRPVKAESATAAPTDLIPG